MKIKLASPISSSELDALYGVCASSKTRTYTQVATHSEECDPNTLFFALDGERVCADALIPSLSSRGIDCVGRHRGQGCYTVRSGKEALLALASHYKRSRLTALTLTVGITGSVGKTTTKDAVATMLAERYRVHKSEGNRNSEIGLPLSILEAPIESEALVLEMGINHPGEMMNLALCAKPDVAVITNIGTAHIGNFGSRQQIAQEKMQVARDTGIPVFVDAEENLTSSLPNHLTVGRGGLYQLLALRGQMLACAPNSQTTLPYPLPPKDIAAALLYAIAIGDYLHLSPMQIRHGAKEILPSCGRRREYLARGIRIIDDAYNASLESVRLALELLGKEEGRKFAVLSDLLELGEKSESIHEKVGQQIARVNLDGVYFLGEMVEHVRRGAYAFGYDVHRIHALAPHDHRGCADRILADMHSGDHLLLKGSHKSALFRIREMLCNESSMKEENP